MNALMTVAALAAAGMLVLAGCAGSPATTRHAATPATRPAPSETAALGPPAGFDWFAARPVPAGWHRAALPAGTATLAYPPSARPLHADPTAIAAGTTATGGQVVSYFNATPQQGAETLATWRDFRLDHLTDDDARTATLDAAATGLAFHGGVGACVLDDYVTRVGAHHYREIACLVTGRHGDSVLVVAALATDWAREQNALEQAVDSYVTH